MGTLGCKRAAVIFFSFSQGVRGVGEGMGLIFCPLKTPILTYETSFKRSNFLAFNVFS